MSNNKIRLNMIRDALLLLGDASRKVAEIEGLVSDVRDNMRLAEYNGNTFCSLPPVNPDVRTTTKVDRNDPCPCGSGLKYKKCCGRGV